MKKHTSKQEYAAFYWDGSNVGALKEWLKTTNVEMFSLATLINVVPVRGMPVSGWAIEFHGDLQGNLIEGHDKWVVVRLDGTVAVDIYDVDTFNKFFVEVAE